MLDFINICENMRKIVNINVEDPIKIYECFYNEKEFVIIMDLYEYLYKDLDLDKVKSFGEEEIRELLVHLIVVVVLDSLED